MKDLTDITVIIDRSGSMAALAPETISSFNKFLGEQQAIPGDAIISVVLFDDKYETLVEHKPLSECPKLDEKTYFVRGTTALYDTLGRTIDAVGHRLAALPEEERPNNVVFCIITDGQDNVPTPYTEALVKKKIEEQQNVYSWKFIFLASNQDAFKTAGTLGISKTYTQSYDSTAVGTQQAWDVKSRYLRSIRTKTHDTH